MHSLDKAIHVARAVIAQREQGLDAARDQLIILEEAQITEVSLNEANRHLAIKMQQTSKFCQWFKLNGGCESCPMWQQDDNLEWRCTL